MIYYEFSCLFEHEFRIKRASSFFVLSPICDTNCKYYICSPGNGKQNFHSHFHSISPSLVCTMKRKNLARARATIGYIQSKHPHTQTIPEMKKLRKWQNRNIIQNSNKNERKSADNPPTVRVKRKQNKSNGFFLSFLYSNALHLYEEKNIS